eukprot:scaffold101080_cov29-Tisochrysis_lutea.AAC.1
MEGRGEGEDTGADRRQERRAMTGENLSFYFPVIDVLSHALFTPDTARGIATARGGSHEASSFGDDFAPNPSPVGSPLVRPCTNEEKRRFSNIMMAKSARQSAFWTYGGAVAICRARTAGETRDSPPMPARLSRACPRTRAATINKKEARKPPKDHDGPHPRAEHAGGEPVYPRGSSAPERLSHECPPCAPEDVVRPSRHALADGERDCGWELCRPLRAACVVQHRRQDRAQVEEGAGGRQPPNVGSIQPPAELCTLSLDALEQPTAALRERARSTQPARARRHNTALGRQILAVPTRAA